MRKFEVGTRVFWKCEAVGEGMHEGFGTIEMPYDGVFESDYWVIIDGDDFGTAFFEPELIPIPASKDLISFYNGTGKDFDGRTLDEILAWDNEKWELDHSFIQWLFPLPETSRFNPFAPLMDEETRKIFSEDENSVVDNVIRAKYRWEKFIGYDQIESKPVWFTKNNHNFLRFSRILRFLDLTNWGGQADAYLIWLLDLTKRFPGIVSERTIEFWKSAAKGEVYQEKIK